MKPYFQHLWHTLRHVLFVFIECCKLGIPLQGLVHDLSKFSPDEFLSYARYHYGKNSPKRRDSTGYYKAIGTGCEEFDRAFFLHSRRNPHHWEYWVMPIGGEDYYKVFDMPDRYRREMLADWRGAGRTYGTSTEEWYKVNSRKIRLHPDTRYWIESQLDLVGWNDIMLRRELAEEEFDEEYD
jgi:hypothetical protein